MPDIALRNAKIIGQENFELWSQGIIQSFLDQ